MTSLQSFQSFRTELYKLFPSRRDAIMDLLDAISSYGHRCDSVVKLSQSKAFRRSYSSITDAITALAKMDGDVWSEAFKLVYQSTKQPINRFAVDVTSNPRPYARTLADRVITHSPNPAPGNKPICVGHPYSVIVGLDEGKASDKHWVTPLSAQRVKSTEKGSEVGMRQLDELIKSLGQSGTLNVSFGDSLYGTNECRKTAAGQKDWVHIFRLRITRHVFQQPPEKKKGRGRKHEYGNKICLQDEDTFPSFDETTTHTWHRDNGKSYTATMSCWKNLLLKGTRDFRSSQYPINVIRIEVKNENDKEVFKRPLWLAVLGDRRHEISLLDAYTGYCSRYDIEHYFRFAKNNLLADDYQTPDVDHEESWWKLCALAYNQLNQANTLTTSTPYPWEQYLPAFKDAESKEISTPSQTQRGFQKLLDKVGTPAKGPTKRGTAPGRETGTEVAKRTKHPVIFKKSKVQAKPKDNNPSSEKAAKNSEPETIESLAQGILKELNTLNYSPHDLVKLIESA